MAEQRERNDCIVSFGWTYSDAREFEETYNELKAKYGWKVPTDMHRHLHRRALKEVKEGRGDGVPDKVGAMAHARKVADELEEDKKEIESTMRRLKKITEDALARGDAVAARKAGVAMENLEMHIEGEARVAEEPVSLAPSEFEDDET